MGAERAGRLLAISDLHVSYPDNRRFIEDLHPSSPADWLIVAGDVAEKVADVGWALGTLADRFEQVIWVPGNHELWTSPKDPVQAHGPERYDLLVDICRRLGVLTPEDDYPTWTGEGGPVQIIPMFLLYDYSFRPDGAGDAKEALALARKAGVVCTDEFLLDPAPYPSRQAWCQARIAATEARLAARGSELPTVLVNHFPLVREPTRVLRYPEFALWCGTEATADWHLLFHAQVVVYGHLHIPRPLMIDGVRFQEVSLGYPRERARYPNWPLPPRQILPMLEIEPQP
jgi:3',5'-cyclic AMP phosphodiesterase CpdA